MQRVDGQAWCTNLPRQVLAITDVKLLEKYGEKAAAGWRTRSDGDHSERVEKREYRPVPGIGLLEVHIVPALREHLQP